MSEVHVWTVTQFSDEVAKQSEEDVRPHPDPDDWEGKIYALLRKAHERGDGLAVYVNQDLGHPELGAWQVVSFGSTESLLFTRNQAYHKGQQVAMGPFPYGDEAIPTRLPDIGAAINWRYTLHAIVPSDQQREKAGG